MALVDKAGLLPVGVVRVEGVFAQQEAVMLVVVERATGEVTSRGEVGRALVNYSAAEITRIIGLQSTEIEGVLGYADSEYIALRENISLHSRSMADGGGKGKGKNGSSRPVTPGKGGVEADGTKELSVR